MWVGVLHGNVSRYVCVRCPGIDNLFYSDSDVFCVKRSKITLYELCYTNRIWLIDL